LSIANRYQVLEPIGRGGFGAVYKAQMLGEGSFAKIVALKILNAETGDNSEMSRRLRDEARILGLIRHRAIVHVDGLLRLNGRWTLVMEYVEGVDLKTLITLGPVPAAAALEILGEVAAALNAAWNREGPNGTPLHLLHRDIKPSNIQITAEGEVKVLDFGIARADFGHRESETKSLIFGSPGYIAPERFEHVDGPAGDMFSLGVILYEMLVGKSYGTQILSERRYAQRLGEATEQVIEVGGNAAVADLMRRMLAYEPGERPTSRDVERTCSDLRRAAHGEGLRDLAERVVPLLRQAHEDMPRDELSNSILIEQAPSGAASTSDATFQMEGGTPGESFTLGDARQAPPLASPAPVPVRRTSTTTRPLAAVGALVGATGLGLVVAGTLLAALVVVGIAWYGMSTEPTPVATSASAPPGPPPGPPPSPPPKQAPVVVSPVLAPPVQPPVLEPPVQPPVPAVAPVAPAPPKVGTPKVDAVKTGHVSFMGVQRAVLVANGKSRREGDVPAGTYEMQVDFGDGSGLIPVGTVTVPAGGSLTLTCQAAFRSCSPI
jgi:serine/threonine protein kinase